MRLAEQLISRLLDEDEREVTIIKNDGQYLVNAIGTRGNDVRGGKMFKSFTDAFAHATELSKRYGLPVRNQADEVSPPGFSGTVRALKKHKEVDNPFALGWSMYNKGYQSHKPGD